MAKTIPEKTVSFEFIFDRRNESITLPRQKNKSLLRSQLRNILTIGHLSNQIVRYTDPDFTKPRLVVFDLDSTLVSGEFMGVMSDLVEDEEKRDEILRLTEEAITKDIDWKTNYRARVAMLKGMPTELMISYFPFMRISRGAKELIKWLHANEIKCAIITGAWSVYAQYIADYLGIEECHATDWSVKNGRLTGRISGRLLHPLAKQRILKEIAQREGIEPSEIVVVADGYNDLEMMCYAKCSFMVNALHPKALSLTKIIKVLQ
ncbi:MAG: HAD-IB family phosphatase [Porphyromonas sp.]|nr:HAD-IB family phosphatase [Porphyromonas sp.]